MKLNHKTTINTSARHGFSLIELMIVIAIIAILMALILPALNRVLGRGDTVAVSAEFTQLDQALTSFKAKFGDYPPSYLKIPSVPVSGTPVWDPKSRAAVKAIWPQFDFNTNGGLNTPVDIFLNGAECMVFFLGGLENGDITSPVVAGFSKNPLSPWTVSENADGPFMEFDLSRMMDADGDKLFEYKDAFPDQSGPILYLSGSGGRYNKDNDPAAPDDYDVFALTDLNMTSCYRQADDKTPQRNDSFQLISPGPDGQYGAGGGYTTGQALPANRKDEADNITNFSGGPLN